jgi:hypothetical protein
LTSKWQSEAIWRDALDLIRSQIAECERPDYILYHRGLLDRAYTDKHVAKMCAR